MKLRTLVILLLLSQSLLGQQKVTERFVETPLIKVFDLLGKKYNANIAFDPAILKDIKVTAHFSEQSLKKVLTELLHNTELSCQEVKSNYYIIVPSKRIWHLSGAIESVDGTPIPYAKIRVKNTYKGAISDVNGHFSFSYKCDSPPTLEISAFGHNKKVVAAPSKNKALKIQLRPMIFEHEEMIAEYLTEGILLPKDLSSFSILPKELGTVPGTTEPDIYRLVQNIPGINTASASVNEIQIRGGTADQNHLLWDGIPIYHPGHFNGMVSSLNPSIIHKASIYRGVYSPYFGGKVSGLIDLHSSDRIPKRFEVGGGVNMLQGDLYTAIPIKDKVAILLSGRKSFTELWQSPTHAGFAKHVYQETDVLNSDHYEQELESGESDYISMSSNDMGYSDINAKIIYRPDTNKLLTASGFFINNKLHHSSTFTSGEKTLNEIDSKNIGGGIHYSHQWNQRWSSDFRANYTLYDYSFLREISYQEEVLSESFRDSLSKFNQLSHFDVKLKNAVKLNETNNLHFGYEFNANKVTYNIYTGNLQENVEENGGNNGLLHALHLDHIWNKNKWLLKSGARFVYSTNVNKFLFEPRLHAQYSLSKPFAIKTSFGIQNQFISQVDDLNELTLGLPNRIWLMNDHDDIPIMNSIMGSLGFIFHKKGWVAEAEAYYKAIDNVVIFSDDPDLSSGLVRGNAVAMGIDVLLKKRWKDYRFWVSYSLSDVSYEFDELYNASFSAPFDQTHIFKWVNTYSWRQFDFSTSFKLASGKPFTPNNGMRAVDDPDPDAELFEQYEIIYGKPFSKKLPVFHQLDVTVLYTIPPNPNKNWKLKIGVSCFNIYNHRNILSRSYGIEANTDDPNNEYVEIFTIDRYYLPIVPNALIRFEFK